MVLRMVYVYDPLSDVALCGVLMEYVDRVY